ncbi:hypothetical protein BN946_scf185011.g13 [Trametes cinnabarina]|uniref:RRM domain-containing protein n=1 Tax=Pycnoporus cinnabarinus TaxID=5643 RepID=A0A060SVX9_PYCCI|nr:hypothetical protein BN946_scf185011.g13 [Trametes cinnabarina]
MSDLDADLYGDLYGNDDNEFAVPTTDQREQPPAKESPEQPEEEAQPQLKREHSNEPQVVKSATPTDKTPTAPAQSEETQYQPVQSHISSTPSSIPSYTSPPAQQIPTYEERQPTDLQEPPPRRDVAYQGVPGVDRPVRPSEMKEEGKMFIGGLNWDTTDESLRKYFSQFGKVEACTIMRDAAGRSRCFAFLTFEDPASVNAVMVREHSRCKVIDPKRAIPRQEHQRATKLFIGGLPGSVTSESMREYFSQFGKVVDATVMLDRETGRSKGFGFVSFENVDVTPMLGFGNLQIDGKLIDVKLAQPRSQREGGFAEQSGGGRGGYTNNSAYGTQNFVGSSGAAAPGPANAPFDPQALAQLYTRMISQIGGMNPMMGGMNPAMMGGQYGAGGMGPGGMGVRGMGGAPMGGMGMGAGAGMGVGRGGPGMGGPGGAGMGIPTGPASLGPNVPRGPRNSAPPTGPSGGVGPQRAGQRGQHSYHPYAR